MWNQYRQFIADNDITETTIGDGDYPAAKKAMGLLLDKLNG